MNNLIHINYFDLGLWKDGFEIKLMLENVLPLFPNVSYSIYGIEASPYCFNSVKKLFVNNPNVHIFNFAINKEKVDSIKLYKSENDELGNSIFKSKYNVYENKYYTVNGNTFSNWLNEEKIDLENSINILKVNIEGAELHLWDDFKKNNLRDKFQIICGFPFDHDVEKVKELKNEVPRYKDLIKELNINLDFFCRTNKELSIETMEKLLKEYINKNI